jgi:nucleoside diphosphate kinase
MRSLGSGARCSVALVLIAAHVSHALKNQALAFIKPHAAASRAVENFVRGHLTAAGISIVAEGSKSAAEIESAKLIDQHYGSLARLAMDVEPGNMALSAAALADFEKAYGMPWSQAVGSAMKNGDALTSLGVDGLELERMWRGGKQLKLAPGTYISCLEGTKGRQLYTVNGFYPAMRQQFVSDGAVVKYFVCEWDETTLSWQQFRQEVIGATDPEAAGPGSCRAELLQRWQDLGLPEAPTMALNGVHASAGPLEGLKERIVWSGAELGSDPFGAALLARGISESTLDDWLDNNPTVTLGGQTDKVFDLTEEMSCDAVLELCSQGMVKGNAAPSTDGAFEAGAPPKGFLWGGIY